MSGGHSKEVGKEKRWAWEGKIGPTVDPPLVDYFSGSFENIDTTKFILKIKMKSNIQKLFSDFEAFKRNIILITKKSNSKLANAHHYKYRWVFEIEKPNIMFLEYLELFLSTKTTGERKGLRIVLHDNAKETRK